MSFSSANGLVSSFSSPYLAFGESSPPVSGVLFAGCCSDKVFSSSSF